MNQSIFHARPFLMLVIEIWVMQIGSGEVSVTSLAQVVMDIVTDLNSSSEFAF